MNAHELTIIRKKYCDNLIKGLFTNCNQCKNFSCCLDGEIHITKEERQERNKLVNHNINRGVIA